MTVGIIGSGNMGGALGTLWAQAGHTVTFSYSRDEEKLARLAQDAGPSARAGSPAEAAEGDVVLLAVGADAVEDALAAAGPLDGKVVVTCVSGLRPDFAGQTVGLPTDLTRSVAEQVAEAAPGAHVVEAFNTTFAEILASESRQFGSDRPSVLYCGDDAGAKATVAGLIEACGYDALDVGPLVRARALETLATAWVQMAVVGDLFPGVGLKVLTR